jgi:hypothetical protein
MLAVTSAERAKRGTALINDALAGLVGSPLTTIETVEQAMAARAEGLTSSEPAPAIAPEVATPLIHAMLDRQYRATLDEPVGMLGDITPRAAVQTAAGRHRVAGGSSISKTAAAANSTRTTRWPPTTSLDMANLASRTCANSSLPLTSMPTVNPCPYNAQRPYCQQPF